MKAVGSRVGKLWRVQVWVVRKGLWGFWCKGDGGGGGPGWDRDRALTVPGGGMGREGESWRIGSVGAEVRWASM